MKRITDFIGENKAGVSILGVVAALFFGMFVASGCRVSDYIDVPVPRKVQQATGSSKTISLTEAEDLREQYVQDFNRGLSRFDFNIEQAQVFSDFASSLLDMGMVAGEGALSGFPGGAVVLSLLTGLGGLYVKRPGTDTEINKEKQASFNAGQRRAAEMQDKFLRTSIGDIVGEKIRESTDASSA